MFVNISLIKIKATLHLTLVPPTHVNTLSPQTPPPHFLSGSADDKLHAGTGFITRTERLTNLIHKSNINLTDGNKETLK